MRATASYLSEVLVAAAIESDAADHDGVSAVGLKTAQQPGSGESRVKYVGKYRYVFRVFSLVFL